MCGRYAASKEAAELVEEFHARKGPDEELAPDYNVAPSKSVYIVVDRPVADAAPAEVERQVQIARWGLVPSWAKDPKIGNRLINARVESAAEKPSFRRAWKTRRCLLPADGYYEWYRGEGGKQPFYIHRADGRSLAMAGLYEFWKDGDDWLVTTCVLTMPAAGALGRIHDRMPVLMPEAEWQAWLDPSAAAPDHVPDLVTDVGLEAYPVASTVNSVRNNGPHLTDPMPEQS